jgi:hypothetical protein
MHRRGYLFHRVPALHEVLRARTNVRIVISSSWRQMHTLEELKNFLGPDLGPYVIDTTGPEGKSRYAEIQAWLKKHRHNGPWLAIDDDNRSWPADLAHHLVSPDPMVGLQARDLDMIKQRLDAAA